MSRRDDWIDDDEYPSDRDIERFGDDSPFDDDELTLGRVRRRASYKPVTPGWDRRRVIFTVIVVLLVLSLLAGELLILVSQ